MLIELESKVSYLFEERINPLSSGSGSGIRIQVFLKPWFRIRIRISILSPDLKHLFHNRVKCKKEYDHFEFPSRPEKCAHFSCKSTNVLQFQRAVL